MSNSLWLVLVPIAVGILALETGNILFKLGVPLSCALILLFMFGRKSPNKSFYFIIAAFLFSMLGDWFLSNKSGRELFFIYGIAAYFIAHIGYSLYAMKNGALYRTVLLILLIIFLPYFYFMLHPAISDLILKSAVFLYLLISLLALSLAFGLEHTPRAKWLFVCGILLIVFSDTIISFTEFLHFRTLNFLILPTYYLAHVSITASLLKNRY